MGPDFWSALPIADQTGFMRIFGPNHSASVLMSLAVTSAEDPQDRVLYAIAKSLKSMRTRDANDEHVLVNRSPLLQRGFQHVPDNWLIF